MNKKKKVKKINSMQLIRNITIAVAFILSLHYMLTGLLNPSLKDYNFLDRDWGFDNITYFDFWVKWLAYISIILISIYPVFVFINSKLRDLYNGVKIKKISNLKPVKYIVFFVIAIVSVILFKSLQIKYDLLGDMKIRMIQTLSGEYELTSYLTMYFLNHVYYLINSKIEISNELFFSWQSFVSGGIYVFFSLLISDLIGKKGFQKIAIFFGGVFIGSILFFFGYKEIYAFPYSLGIVAVYFNLLYAKGKISFIFPLIITLSLPIFHILLSGIIPATFIIFFQKNKEKFPKRIKNIKTHQFLLLILIVMIIIYAFSKTLKISFFLMPIKSTENGYDFITLFDLRHIWQYINAICLATGVGFLVFLILAFVAARSKIKFDAVMWYLGSASFFMLLLIFVAHPIRGSGDWDIFALPALFVNLTVIYFVIFMFNDKPHLYKYIISIILTINFISSASWVMVNHTDKSIDKITDMLINDPGNYYKKGQPAIQQLAFGLEANGLDSIALKYFELNYKQNYRDTRAHFNYAVRLINKNRKEEGVKILENLTQSAPHYGMAYPALINVYNNDKNYKQLYETVNKLYNAYLKYPKPISQKINKEQLLSYFDYLYKVEMNFRNTQRANEIMQVVNKLK